jgi:hypothetical protein
MKSRICKIAGKFLVDGIWKTLVEIKQRRIEDSLLILWIEAGKVTNFEVVVI